MAMLFDDRYEVFLADTHKARNLHYRLRYQVYYEETGWETSTRIARRKLERDKFDPFSRHFLVRDRLTLEWVGGVRLIVSPYEALPIAKVCEIEHKPGINLDKYSCVEVSRLFVLPDYRCGRRRASGQREGAEISGARCRSHFEVLLGLIRATREYVLLNDLASWYFLVEPPLARTIQRLGIDLLSCGPSINHRGIRKPYYGEVATSFSRLFSGRPETREMFSKTNTYRLCSEISLENEDLAAREFRHRSGKCIQVSAIS
jgi:N-acyl amino acid synthase of PEP-CTERM/exosortase system